MDQNAKRFARRILLIHLLLLVVVLGLVAGAAREIYQRTREQMIAQEQQRQDLLARQTATGIESHYQSILNDLDLLHREENAQSSTDVPAGDRPFQPPNVPAQVSDPIASSRAPIIGQVMWKQLQGRVSLLFSLDHRMMNARFMIRPGATTQPQPTITQMIDLRLIGTNDTRIAAMEVLHRTHQWIDKLTEPSLSPFDVYNGVGVNVICIPLARGRDLLAVVPIHGIESQFLKPLNNDPNSGGWLIDEAGTAMAASRPDLVGTTAADINDSDLHSLALECIANHASGTQVIARNFTIGSAKFVPSMITAHPVLVGNKKWELFVTTSLEDVDGVVAKLMHRALLWCLFVVLSVTAILVSTAIWIIRSRSRMERLRHESLERELAQARQIQLAWLPEPHPQDDSLDIAAVNSPASHISGDFYNWFALPDGRMAVTVGDVTGHGMSAAFLMATTQLLVRNTLVRLADPGRCLEEVNRQLCVQVFNGQFVTMVLMLLDLQRNRMQIATAGHPAPLIATGDSFKPIPLEPQLVLGVDRDTKYVTETYKLPPQASLLLYTDGVVECPNSDFKRFGDERLRTILHGRYGSAAEMLQHVMRAVDDFRGPRVLDDDLTMVAVQVQAARPEPVRTEAALAV
jgi:serine phosphatase RsbU (regulator of sigma subunit)